MCNHFIIRLLLLSVFLTGLPVHAFALKPTVDDQMYVQLQGVLKNPPWANVYDVDLFDTDISKIVSLHKEGKKVICYFSAGTHEEWREDADKFASKDIGMALEEWDGERWLDIRSLKVRKNMKSRLDLAVKKGCDGVDPDNVDGYTNDTGFSLRYKDSLSYNVFLAREAHKRGLVIGLKNNMDQLNDLKTKFDFAINEQCHEYNECTVYRDFVRLKKLVFNLEYNEVYLKKNGKVLKEMCAKSKKLGIISSVYSRALDGSVHKRCSQ